MNDISEELADILDPMCTLYSLNVYPIDHVPGLAYVTSLRLFLDGE